MDQIDVIDSILAIERTVMVCGQQLVLRPPTEAAARQLRKLQVSMAPSLRDDEAEQDLEQLADLSLTLAGSAVSACIEGLDESRAIRLVLVTGGESGELARAALELCGVAPAVTDALMDGAADDPT